MARSFVATACPVCGEPFMAVKGVSRGDGVTVCRGCAGQGLLQVEGLGIVGNAQG
ncbi:MAG: hypothetical protein V3571_00210 [Pseudodesulfovibrio sp.]